MTELIFEVADLIVHVYCDDVDAVLALDEAQHRGIHLGGPYSAIYHKAHTNPGEDHIQVFMKNSKVFALNISGTAHDRSHGVRIPNRAAKGIQKRFPNVQLPKDNVIECMTVLDELSWVTRTLEHDAYPRSSIPK